MTQINNYPINFNIPKLCFQGVSAPAFPRTSFGGIKDGFVSNPLTDNFANPAQIEAEAKQNPHIQAVMKEYNLPIKVNAGELEKLQRGHLRETRVIAAKIYSSLPKELKEQVDLPSLQEAAMLHDYGKILIPDEILNKKGALTEEEKEIMKLHSELGYELLKNKGYSEKTLNLVKYHHQNQTGTGYPAAGADYEYGLELQILQMADKYNALREERSYKGALDKEDTLATIQSELNSDNVSQEIFEALKKAA